MLRCNNATQLYVPRFLAQGLAVNKKSAKIAALIDRCQGQELDAHYLGYFDCFNRGLFYESHDVLEELWLAERAGPDAAFYKGLIQFAGAFVHMQKHSQRQPRLRPAAALLRLAQSNLQKYPAVHHQLDVARMIALVASWLSRLEAGDFARNPLATDAAPQLELLPP
jgi:predicted metal-dependent hydrolase